MKVNQDCIPCTVQSCVRLMEAGFVPEDKQESLLRHTLAYLAEADYEQSPPALAQGMHRLFRQVLGDSDPYREIKRQSNALMLERREELRRLIRESPDPLATALRLAMAGNVMDFGARRLFDPLETIGAVQQAELARDDSEDLRRALVAARHVLYVGDNAGEIVTDALLLETMAHPQVTFVVRGAPVLNDITEEDARAVGLDQLARIITTGDDAPGVILATASAEFHQAFAVADVVISKGQGNLEGLIDAPREVYFLLTTKCHRIARRLGVGEGAFVLWRKPAGD